MPFCVDSGIFSGRWICLVSKIQFFFNEIQSKKIKGLFNLYTLTMNLNTIIQCEYI
jgi:hypothetical protein